MRLGNNIQSVIQVHCTANSGAFKQVVMLNNTGNTFHLLLFWTQRDKYLLYLWNLTAFDFYCFQTLNDYFIHVKANALKDCLELNTTDKKERHQNLLETSCPFSNNRLSTQLLQIFAIRIIIIKHHKSPKTLTANSSMLV